MGFESSQFIERLSWDGVVSGPTAVAIVIALALVAAWALWRERAAIGNGWAVTFWILRLVAFGIALWMVAGPTWLQIRRSSTNQSIAVFADNSDSMEIVDPVENLDSVRWALAIADAGDDSPMARCDRMSVALSAALLGSEQLARFAAEHRSTKQMRGMAASIQSAIDRSLEHARFVHSSVGERDSALSDRALRIATLLDGPIREALAAVLSAMDDSRPLDLNTFRTQLEAILENVASARRRSLALASDLAEHFATTDSLDRQAADRLTRREKERRSLEVFEKELQNGSTADVRVQRFQFADAPSPVAGGDHWDQVLQDASAADQSPSMAPGSDDNNGEGSAPRATNVSAVLEQLAQDRSSQATRMAIIWTDGRHNDLEAAVPQEVAAGLAGLPVFFVSIGNSAPLRDVVVHRVEAPTAVAEKDTAVIDVIVTGFETDGEASDVVLRREGTEIERKSIEFSGDRSDARIRFTVPADKLGRNEYVVGVEPLNDEVNAANNYMPVAFDVVREHIRVLLADSSSRWEFRYLSQLFRRDTHVECDELLFFPRVNGTGRLAERPELPRDVASWAGYDVVILGDLDVEQLPAASQKSLDEYVRLRGGNLIVIAGRDAMPGKFSGQFLELLPVELSGQTDPPEGYGLRLTDEGRSFSALLIDDSESTSRQAWQQIYARQPVHWLSEYSRPKSTARTLIRAVAESAAEVSNDQPDASAPAFLCWQRAGAGRVVYISAPVTYVLRLLEGDRMHHRFWGQMLRWITAAGAGAGTDMVRLQADRMRYAAGEPVEVTVWLKDKTGQPLGGQSIQIEARTFEDSVVTADMTADVDVAGRYFAVLPELPAGAYNLTVRGAVIDQLMSSDPNTELAQATISVRAADHVEMMNTQCNRPLLEQIARMTGGQVIPPTAVSELLHLISFSPEVSEKTERTPLWNRWSNVLILLGCLFTEWIVRKAKGLV